MASEIQSLLESFLFSKVWDFNITTITPTNVVEEIKLKLDELSNEDCYTYIDEHIGDSMEKAYLLRRLKPNETTH